MQDVEEECSSPYGNLKFQANLDTVVLSNVYN